MQRIELLQVMSLYDKCLLTVAELSDSLGWNLVKDLPHHVLCDLIHLLPICCLNAFHDDLNVKGINSQYVWIKHFKKKCKINKYNRRREFRLPGDISQCDWRQKYHDNKANMLLRQLMFFDDNKKDERVIKALTDPLVQPACLNISKSCYKYTPKSINIWGKTCNTLANNPIALEILANNVEEITFEHLLFPSESEAVADIIHKLLQKGHLYTITLKDVKYYFLDQFLYLVSRKHQLPECLMSSSAEPPKKRMKNDRSDLKVDPLPCSAISQLRKISLIGVGFLIERMDTLRDLFSNIDGLEELELIDNDISSSVDILSCLGLSVNNGQRLPSVFSYEQNIISGCFKSLQEIIRYQGITETSNFITHLSLEFCSMTSLMLSQLFSIVSENKKIIFLSVHGNQANSMQSSLVKLFQDGCLQFLDLGQTKFTLSDQGITTDFVMQLLSAMMNNQHLKYLGLASTLLSDACLMKLAEGLTDESSNSQLNRMDISFNSKISSEGLRTFGIELQQSFIPLTLEHLRLQHNYTVGNESSYFKALHEIVTVHLAGPSEDIETDFTDHVANM
ncbi:uncharacterized protein [Antedon mediterranea]|uniref:uncharacterized protein n=1 Tax=Antedon mediterranea TaxID=105859 RepID=UPI003AF7FDF0